MEKSTKKALFVTAGTILLVAKIYEIFTEPNFGFSTENITGMGASVTATLTWVALSIGLLYKGLRKEKLEKLKKLQEKKLTVIDYLKWENDKSMLHNIGKYIIIFLILSFLWSVTKSVFNGADETKIINNNSSGLIKRIDKFSGVDNKQALLSEKLFNNLKEKTNELIYCESDDSYNLFQASSFETKESINTIINKIDKCISRIDNRANNFASLVNEQILIIDKSDLDIKDREAFKEGYLKSINNMNDNSMENMFNIIKKYRSSTRELYSYMLVNFNNYTIDLGENNEKGITFKYQKNIDNYTTYTDKISSLMEEMRNARTQNTRNLDKYLDDNNINNVNANDVLDYINK